jgi:hypothetical protein
VTASLSQYLPLGDLAKILVACLVVAVAAPSAVTLGIVGLDRRTRAVKHHSSTVAGTLLVGLAVAILAALIGLGLAALINR